MKIKSVVNKLPNNIRVKIHNKLISLINLSNRIIYYLDDGSQLNPVSRNLQALAPFSKSMPNPTPQMLNNDPFFEAIWMAIKNWDINVPEYYNGYCGANGSHVAIIYEAIMKAIIK